MRKKRRRERSKYRRNFFSPQGKEKEEQENLSEKENFTMDAQTQGQTM